MYKKKDGKEKHTMEKLIWKKMWVDQVTTNT